MVKSVPRGAREQLTFVCSDRCSLELHNKIASVFPRFLMMCLDPTHLVMAYEAASARRKTPGSQLLRHIMRRFAARFDPASPQPPMCTHIFRGQTAPPLTRREQKCQNWIGNSNMPIARARAVAGAQAGAGPWQSRAEFTEAIAALCTLFPVEVDRVSPGANRKIADILLFRAK